MTYTNETDTLRDAFETDTLRDAFARFEAAANPPRERHEDRVAARDQAGVSPLADLLCRAFPYSETRTDNAAAVLAQAVQVELLRLDIELNMARRNLSSSDRRGWLAEQRVTELAQSGMVIANVAFGFEAENERLRDALRETGVNVGHEPDGDEGAMDVPLPDTVLGRELCDASHDASELPKTPWSTPELTELSANDQRVTEAIFGELDGGLLREREQTATADTKPNTQAQ